ncbi:MAG: extracellular solute-binding protein, partial [Actinobacteria bacterium]|nr:extracellular solute-binding protein [Actinomycetota bacterium]
MQQKSALVRMVLALLSALVLAAVAGACGGSEQEETGGDEPAEAQGPVADPEEPVTVTFASWVGNEPAMKKMAKEFQKQHPNITIKFQNVPFEQIGQKLTTQIAGGNPPDAAFIDAGTTADFASRGALVPLDDYFARSDVVAKEDFVEAFNVSTIYEGQQYGIPF